MPDPTHYRYTLRANDAVNAEMHSAIVIMGSYRTRTRSIGGMLGAEETPLIS
jgi:hypothetical protein